MEEEDVYHAGGRRAEGRAGGRRHRGASCRSSALHLRRRDAALRPDRPDRRIGMEIATSTDVFRGSGVQGLRGRGRVRRRGARASSAGGEFPRSRFDELTEQAQALGREGSRLGGRSRRTAGARRSPSSCRRTRCARADRGARRRRGRRDPASWPTAPRWPRACSATLRAGGGRWRARRPRPLLGHRLPDVRVERGRGALGSRYHHPFTAPKGDLDGDPGTWRSRAYDLVLDGGRDRRRLDPDQPARGAAEGVRRRSASDRGGGGALRLPARGAALRRAAARRHRVRLDRIVRAAGRPRVDPRRDRVPQGRERRRTRSPARPAPVDERQLRELGLRSEPGR